MEHEFELRFRLCGSTGAEALVDRLYEAGCDDAVVGSGRARALSLMFIREAASALEAIASAVKDVKSAAVGAELVSVRHETVCLKDLTTYL